MLINALLLNGNDIFRGESFKLAVFERFCGLAAAFSIIQGLPDARPWVILAVVLAFAPPKILGTSVGTYVLPPPTT